MCRVLTLILRLVHTTASIAAGDLTQRTGIESIDEIGHLAKSFDIMTAKLEQRTSELEDLLRLMENEASKIRAILTSIADGVLVHDLTGVIIEKNPAAERILADATDEAELKQITELDTSTHGTETHDQLKRLTIGKRTIDTIASLVITTNNKILGSVVVLRDITKEVENERLKDEFIGNISHELRTPIIVIKGYIQILQMFSMGQWPENQVDLLQKIAMSTDDLHNLITTVIDMTEIEAGELGIDKYDFTLDDLLCDVEGKWESIMEEREITFTLHIVDENMMVEGDEVQLQKIFDYLLDNASKYNRPGGRVDVYAFKEGDFAQIDIKDSGVGIVEREEQSIFERFVRALHEDFYETRGLGLGLYLARAITNVHGGKIWYESEIDKGSTFSFTIPCFISPDSDLPGF
ncbi:MAG: hypothetical protein B6242_15680 [Anaerolineaceae bacterium 4572_78]|nr:MAG: hypothetical protein B6242_15680 [Anaerolineaceae bacterium 4572_78]